MDLLAERRRDDTDRAIIQAAFNAVMGFLSPFRKVDAVNLDGLPIGVRERPPEGFCFDTTAIPGWPPELADVALAFFVNDSDSYRGNYSRTRRPFRWGRGMFNAYIQISLVDIGLALDRSGRIDWPKAFAQAARTFLMTHEFRLVFKHEVAHAIDYLHTGHRQYSSSERNQYRLSVGDPDDRGHYYNSSTEVNSYFSMLIDPLSTVLNNPPEIGAYKLYELTGNAQKDMAAELKRSVELREWWNHLSEDNRRRVVKRYKTVHDTMLRHMNDGSTVET